MATWPLGRPPTICAELPPRMWALALHRGEYGAPGEVLRVDERDSAASSLTLLPSRQRGEPVRS
jgi:hypothetical protein